jgi:uncharacterized protein (TIGR02996 family)
MDLTTDARALLAAIYAHPDEDTPRLMYADCVQERGDEERAEFIRVQVALALAKKGLQLCHYPDFSKPARSGQRSVTTLPYECQLRCPLCRHLQLSARESAILSRRCRAEWSRCPVCKGDGGLRASKGTLITKCGFCIGSGHLDCDFSRGFVSCVRVPTIASVLQRDRVQCPRCRPMGTRKEHGVTIQQLLHCGSCPDGTVEGDKWQPTPAAVALLAAYPTVRQVVPVDRVPHDNGDDVMWCRNFPNQQGTDHWGLPAVVFNALRWARVEDRGAPYRKSYFYPTPDAATSALGTAIRDLIAGT